MKILKRRTHSKTNASLISIVQRFFDVSVIIFGLCFVYYVAGIDISSNLFLNALIVLFVFQMIGGVTDFYRSWRGVRLISELKLVLQNWSLSLIIAVGFISLSTRLQINFDIYMCWYVVVSFGIVLCRILIRYCFGKLRRFGYNTRRVAIAGSMEAGIELLKSFNDEPWLGFKVEGIYNDNVIHTAGIRYVGDFEQLIADAKNGKLDRIYIAMNMSDEKKIKLLVRQLTNTTCSVMLIPDIFTFNILQSRTEEVNGVPVVPLFDTPLNGINMVFKRLEDIILSILILTLISPVLIIISFAVKLTSSGPVIFRQTRYGMDGKPIKVWKFRSMKVMEDGGVVTQAKQNDIRVTRVGRFLRRTSLDELPQFFNVLSGEMSIVGPRPHAVAHNEQYRDLIEGYMLRHKVKPGITGWAQINGWRGETDTLEKMQKRVEYDLDYIREWSIWFDLYIIILTVFKGFVSKTAY
ncbi:TPA: undecaprenyl-phosphate glucose phosphotransferase [Klebsiella pneumoniae]|uniref:undecaprenyl-phosphate glucose phosphotransferase n=1 Tax=Klebsiella pneumoniae TaxID=573 RepID=UPI000E2C3A35|nr:undecaprenyl-phosphate glucose phosphotransferase [Klebsiella pneumoniae]MBE4996606.1 undecaprenyl-phosphate glucose phosphotransferase [Klebsiella pneumoniae]SYU53483.1 UDP-phosphate glucose phosphotransferase [Klebsiella pneumoniae]HBZ9114581.1 undecaprenyl-phosphate glucose phosphotransferase [Klebsiella pneumoniae]HBZ9331309.1 undecaprenyl-phosphate glucose phosphotransferase [Klebsiella pneumoniae]HBZ9694403.1 undecaprenyl-phosphate glucose phosphotransferase [Klebsiella pneumoniae]